MIPVRRHLRRTPAGIGSEGPGRGTPRIIRALPKQVWCPRPRSSLKLFMEGGLDLERTVQFSPVSGTGFKPRGPGVIWTSTWTPDKPNLSEWHAYMHRLFGETTPSEECFVLVPREDLRIYEVDGRDNLIWLVENYSDERLVKTLGRRSEDTLDWGKIARDFDAVHLTKKGQIDVHWYSATGAPTLWGWDVESTVWLHPVTAFKAYIGGTSR